MATAVVACLGVFGYLTFGAVTAQHVFSRDTMDDGSIVVLWCFLWPLMALGMLLLKLARYAQ